MTIAPQLRNKPKHGHKGDYLMKALTTLAILIVGAVLIVPAHGDQRTIEVHAKRFAFSPAEITVKRGDTVTLTLISDDVPHSLLIEGLGVNAAMVKGHPSEVKITPGKAGDFSGRCGRFCGSGHGQMNFVVHVTE
jgi:cytochrome c oxidase subunit II